jgi:FixJ family two-component response regulator
MFLSKLDHPVALPEHAGDGVALHVADPASYASVCKILQGNGIRASAQGLIERSRPFPCWNQACCVVAELGARHVTALSVLRTIRNAHACLPVILIAEKPPISTVVDAMRWGAFDFFEKPWDAAMLAHRIEEGILAYRRTFPVFTEIARVEQLIKGLTRRERQLFDLVLDGKSTKEIAFELEIREVTVDFHRRNLYRKMEVSNAVNLAIMIENYRHEKMKTVSERTAF